MKNMLEKELSKLRNRGATGISIFVRKDKSYEDYAKDIARALKGMKKSKTKIMG